MEKEGVKNSDFFYLVKHIDLNMDNYSYISGVEI